ncbi:MAG: hypothetical protein AAB573_00060 [Patescibacteria group bacterium]
MSMWGDERLAKWLDTPAKVNSFITTLRNTGSYGKAGEKVGANKSKVCGAVLRAGGLENFLSRAGVEKPSDVAAEIKKKTQRGWMATKNQRNPGVRFAKSFTKAAEKPATKTMRRDVAIDRYMTHADKRYAKKGSDPRVGAVADALGTRGPHLIPGVQLDRGRALIKGQHIDPRNPPMQTYARIKLDQPSRTAPQSDVLAASLKRDLESHNSTVGRAAQKAGIQRVSIAIQTDKGLLPIIDRTL